MTVRELRSILDNLDDDMEVVLALDAEGNRFQGVGVEELVKLNEVGTSSEDLTDVVIFYPDDCDVDLIWPDNEDDYW